MMQWQMCPKWWNPFNWGFSYSTDYDQVCSVTMVWLIIGPLQMYWYE